MTFFRGKEDSEWKNEEEKMRRKRRRRRRRRRREPGPRPQYESRRLS